MLYTQDNKVKDITEWRKKVIIPNKKSEILANLGMGKEKKGEGGRQKEFWTSSSREK